MAEDIKQILQKLTEFGELKKEIQTRLSLVTFAKGFPREKLELMVQLAETNQWLEECYEKVKNTKPHSRREDYYLRQIQHHEDKRFQILYELNGSEVQDYGVLPLDIAE